MTTRAAFLVAIRAKPDCDLTRLVYADWLDEQGEGERAELIRIQIHFHAWAKNLDLDMPAGGITRLNDLGVQFWKSMAPDDGQVDFQDDRGFVCAVVLHFASWVAFADRILPDSVRLTVRLTDRPQAEDNPFARFRTAELVWRLVGLPNQTIVTSDTVTSLDDDSLKLLLAMNWPDVANWELPPELGEGYRRVVHDAVQAVMRNMADRIDVLATSP